MKLIEVTDEMLRFDDGTIVTYYHGQDCCEHVYADFKVLQDKIGQDFRSLEIEKVKDSGFRIGGEFVPCYDDQNGYYSSDLELQVSGHSGMIKTIDITDCAFADYN